MQIRTEGDVVFVKLESGEKVHETIMKICDHRGISSGSIEFGIGMLKDYEIGYFNGKEYEKITIAENGELLSFHGSIAENDPRLHIHAALARRDHTAIGGHLFSATADPLVELQIRIFSRIRIRREINPKTGLSEISLS